MIQLVSLPGLKLDCPDINMPLLKGFLKEHRIHARHTDLNIESFYTRLSSQSQIIASGGNPAERQKLGKLFHSISVINGSEDSSYEVYQEAGIIIRKAMRESAKPYGLIWDTKGIEHSLSLNAGTITEESLKHPVFGFFDDIFDRFASSLAEEDRYVVLSVTSQSQYPFAIRLAKKIKENGNHRIIITGNYLPYISESLPLIAKEAWWINCHILGYPEDIFLDLLEREDWLENKILETRHWKSPEKNASLHLSSTPDFSDLTLSLYLSKELVLPLQITNGCYYGKCRFCSFHYGDGSYFLAEKEQTEKNISTYVNQYHARHILFVDRCIPASEVLQMCRYIISKSYKIDWLLETRIDPLYSMDENVALLKKAGCKVISFGIESADQELLNRMNKGIDFSLAEECMGKISGQGICVASTIMLLYLGETFESLKKTLDYLLTNTCIDLFGILAYSLTKHSPVYDENKQMLEPSTDPEKSLNQTYDRTLLADEPDQRQIDLINHFYSESIVKEHFASVSKTIFRSHYLFWPKEKYSFQSRKQLQSSGF